MATVRVGIAGATGYLGQELLRLLASHPRVAIAALASTSHAGKAVGDVLPAFRGAFDAPRFVPLDAVAFDGCDVVLTATPHGVAKALAPPLLAAGKKVIDLSGDHRLRDARVARAHYGDAGAAQGEAVYGLPEANREAIRRARLVATPGCYPTVSAIAALPLLQSGLALGPVVVDAKSGVSGAGKEPSAALHYPETNESVRAYKVGEHRHGPEIAQSLSDAARQAITVAFTPHIVPMNRGILATVYLFPSGVPAPEADLVRLYRKTYDGHPFVRVVPDEPDTKHVRGTNWCDVRPHGAASGAYVVTAAIDNLVKGGSGQAVQNLNLMSGFPEDLGLPKIGGGP